MIRILECSTVRLECVGLVARPVFKTGLRA